MRTIEEWYLSQDEKVAKFLLSKIRSYSALLRNATTIATAIHDGFSWNHTTEGYDFWQKVYKEYENSGESKTLLNHLKIKKEVKFPKGKFYFIATSKEDEPDFYILNEDTSFVKVRDKTEFPEASEYQLNGERGYYFES